MNITISGPENVKLNVSITDSACVTARYELSSVDSCNSRRKVQFAEINLSCLFHNNVYDISSVVCQIIITVIVQKFPA